MMPKSGLSEWVAQHLKHCKCLVVYNHCCCFQQRLFYQQQSRSEENYFWYCCYKYFVTSNFSNAIEIILLICYLISCYPVVAVRRYEYSNVFEDGKYRCYQDVLTAPLMKLARQTIFDQPCKCRVDWKLAFCKDLASIFSKRKRVGKQLPEVCICRQFLDAYPNCYQFITRCFKKDAKQCSCCFNQPEKHCNQLPCSNGEPVFARTANTTCVCYSPSSYPYQICPRVNFSHAMLSYALEEPTGWSPGRRQQKLTTENEKIEEDGVLISGLRITPKNACIILFSLIGGSILLTSIWITIRYLRLKKEHVQRSVRLQNAQAALLQRRVDEDRYLP